MKLMALLATMVPLNLALVPKLTVLVTCQNTFSHAAALMSRTLDKASVESAPTILMMNTAPGSPWPSSTSSPASVEAPTSR